MYACAFFSFWMITYGTRSPTFGAEPGSRFAMRSASSTCAARVL